MSNAPRRHMGTRAALSVSVAAALILGAGAGPALASTTVAGPFASTMQQTQPTIKTTVALPDNGDSVAVGQVLDFTASVLNEGRGTLVDLVLDVQDLPDASISRVVVLDGGGATLGEHSTLEAAVGAGLPAGHTVRVHFTGYMVTEDDLTSGELSFSVQASGSYVAEGTSAPELVAAVAAAEEALQGAQDELDRAVSAEEESAKAQSDLETAESDRDAAAQETEDLTEQLAAAREVTGEIGDNEKPSNYDTADATLDALAGEMADLRDMLIGDPRHPEAVAAMAVITDHIGNAKDKLQTIRNERTLVQEAYDAFDEAIKPGSGASSAEILAAATDVIDANGDLLAESATGDMHFRRVEQAALNVLQGNLFPPLAEPEDGEEHDEYEVELDEAVHSIVSLASTARQAAADSYAVTTLVDDLARAQRALSVAERGVVEKYRARQDARTNIEVQRDDLAAKTQVRDDAQVVVDDLEVDLDVALEEMHDAARLVDSDPDNQHYAAALATAQSAVAAIEGQLANARAFLTTAEKERSESEEELNKLVAARAALEPAVEAAELALAEAVAARDAGMQTTPIQRPAVPVTLTVLGAEPGDDPTEDPTDDPTEDPTDPGEDPNDDWDDPVVTDWVAGDYMWADILWTTIDFTVDRPAVMMAATVEDLSDAVVVEHFEAGTYSWAFEGPAWGGSVYYFLANADGLPITDPIVIHNPDPADDEDPTEDPTDPAQDPDGDDDQNPGGDDGDDQNPGGDDDTNDPGGLNGGTPIFGDDDDDNDTNDPGGLNGGVPIFGDDDDDDTWTNGESPVVSNESLTQSGAPLTWLALAGLVPLLGGAGLLIWRRRRA